MKIGIQTWGSDGDILPILALAQGLSSAGHDVTLAYTSIDDKDYSHLVTTSNIKLVKLVSRFQGDSGKILNQVTQFLNPINELALILEYFFEPVTEDMYEASKTLCIENDLVIGHMINHTLLTASQKYQCPRVSVAFCPSAIQSKYITGTGINFGRIVNNLFWELGDLLVRKKCFKNASKIRLREGLPPLRSLSQELFISKDLTLISTSNNLASRQKDWGENIEICGHLTTPNINTQWEIPGDLENFLNSGEAPIYFSFGSCTQFDIVNTTKLFIDTIKLLPRRAIVQSHWDEFPFQFESPDVYKVNRIPHEKIFPYCSMVVHHGGTGSTHSSLRAGKPSLVVAHAFDQPYWGRRLEQLGLGKLIYRRFASPKKMADKISLILSSSSIQDKAKRLGESMKQEQGVNRAVELIEKQFVLFHPSE